VRTKFGFDFVTTAAPDQVIELMTDFSPNRPHRWPASSVKAFEVYHLGETEADIREGQDFPKLWATWHSDWSTPGTVTLTVVASDAMAAGGFMTLTATPTAEDGSSVHGVGTDLEEPHGAHGGDDDAVHRPAVPVVVLQVRRQRRQ